MRVLLGLCLALLLGACNRVHSDRPLFFADAGPDAPRLREGLWVLETGDEPCRFDTARPVNRWPKCADWMLVRDGALVGYTRPEKGKAPSPGDWATVPYVLAAGAPPVLQVAMTDDGKVDHQFFGVAATSGPVSAITAFAAWPVYCGPPPPKPAKGEKARFVSLEPLPGMIVGDDNCAAESAAAVLNAAGPSRSWAEGEHEVGGARWVRDTYP